VTRLAPRGRLVVVMLCGFLPRQTNRMLSPRLIVMVRGEKTLSRRLTLFVAPKAGMAMSAAPATATAARTAMSRFMG
jgi:hypothetical protein